MQLTVADVFRNPKLGALANLETSDVNTVDEEIAAFSLLRSDITQVRREAALTCNIDASLIGDIFTPARRSKKD